MWDLQWRGGWRGRRWRGGEVAADVAALPTDGPDLTLARIVLSYTQYMQCRSKASIQYVQLAHALPVFGREMHLLLPLNVSCRALASIHACADWY